MRSCAYLHDAAKRCNQTMEFSKRQTLPQTDNTWTLFLDRDGVINYEKENDYIHTWNEFRFYEGVTEAMRIFSEKLGRVVIVTNQRGVGRGLTLLENLQVIHRNMQKEIEMHGGRIDAIYFCDAVDSDHPSRKPNPGMAHEAKKCFPEIDFSKSIMVGNTLSDMEFGRNIGAFTVFLPTTRPGVPLNHPAIDAVFPSLLEFARALG